MISGIGFPAKFAIVRAIVVDRTQNGNAIIVPFANSRITVRTYQFKFGMGFLREANKLTVVPVQGMPGTTKEIGARYLIASVVVDQEPNALVDLLDLANKGENPRVTKAMLDSYIDSEEVDIDELMEKTKDFLSKANATKKAVKEILKEYEEQMAKKQQAQEQ